MEWRSAYLAIGAVFLGSLCGCTGSSGTSATVPMKLGLWEVNTRSNNPQLTETYKTCIDDVLVPAHHKEIVRMAADRAAGKCVSKSGRAVNGAEFTEADCRLGGRDWISRVTTTVIAQTAVYEHGHLVTTVKQLGHWFGDRTWIDSERTYLGSCPPGLLPGQHLLPNGTIRNVWTISQRPSN